MICQYGFDLQDGHDKLKPTRHCISVSGPSLGLALDVLTTCTADEVGVSIVIVGVTNEVPNEVADKTSDVAPPQPYEKHSLAKIHPFTVEPSAGIGRAGSAPLRQIQRPSMLMSTAVVEGYWFVQSLQH